MSRARKAIAAILLWLAGATLAGSLLTFLNIFADYKDSPDSTYVFFAGIELAFAAGFAAIGALLLHDRSHPAAPGERRRRAFAGVAFALAGAGSIAALTLGYELSDIANDPSAEAEYLAGTAGSVVIAATTLIWGTWSLQTREPLRVSRRLVIWLMAVSAAAGIGFVYLVTTPRDDERLAGALAVAHKGSQAVGCTKQDGDWFYCQVLDPSSPTTLIVTFDGDCWQAMAPRSRKSRMVGLEVRFEACMRNRGVGRTGSGPGDAPDQLAEAASRFLPDRYRVTPTPPRPASRAPSGRSRGTSGRAAGRRGD